MHQERILDKYSFSLDRGVLFQVYIMCNSVFKKYILSSNNISCLHLHNNFTLIVTCIFCFIGSSLILGYKRSNASGTLKCERTQHERPHILDQEFDTYLRFES